MTCPNCATSIDYRFTSSCMHCEVDLPTGAETADDPAPIISSVSRQPMTAHIVNTLFILVCSSIGILLGAVVMYFVGVIAFINFVRNGNPSHDCSAGGAVTALSILFGGYLGCIVGSIQGYRNRRVYRERLKECR